MANFGFGIEKDSRYLKSREYDKRLIAIEELARVRARVGKRHGFIKKLVTGAVFLLGFGAGFLLIYFATGLHLG
jgi:hypothetical protein